MGKKWGNYILFSVFASNLLITTVYKGNYKTKIAFYIETENHQNVDNVNCWIVSCIGVFPVVAIDVAIVSDTVVILVTVVVAIVVIAMVVLMTVVVLVVPEDGIILVRVLVPVVVVLWDTVTMLRITWLTLLQLSVSHTMHL